MEMQTHGLATRGLLSSCCLFTRLHYCAISHLLTHCHERRTSTSSSIRAPRSGFKLCMQIMHTMYSMQFHTVLLDQTDLGALGSNEGNQKCTQNLVRNCSVIILKTPNITTDCQHSSSYSVGPFSILGPQTGYVKGTSRIVVTGPGNRPHHSKFTIWQCFIHPMLCPYIKEVVDRKLLN